MKEKLKIIYMAGGSEYTLNPLKKLLESSHEVVCVYTKKIMPSGRGRKLKQSPLLEFIKFSDLNYRTPINFNSFEENDYIKKLKPDICIVFSYGIILPKKILDVPKSGCINIHASLLPRWRGPAPVQYSLINCETKTGFSLMKMNEGIDEGDIIFKKEIDILNCDNTLTLLNKISKESSRYLIQSIEDYANDKIKIKKQKKSEATFSFKIKKQDAYIKFNESAKSLLGKIRAFFPNPCAKCFIKGEVVKILEAQIEEEKTSFNEYGIILDNQLLVACKTGAIRFTKIQRQGKKAMDAKVALNGWNVKKGLKVNEEKK